MLKTIFAAAILLFSATSVFAQTLLPFPDIPREYRGWDAKEFSCALPNGRAYTATMYMFPTVDGPRLHPGINLSGRMDYILMYAVNGKNIVIWSDTGMKFPGETIESYGYFLRPDGQWIKMPSTEYSSQRQMLASQLTTEQSLTMEMEEINSLCTKMHWDMSEFFWEEFNTYRK